MAEPKFGDPRMQALHEQCEARAAADKPRQDAQRLAEWERRMVTGEPSAMQKRLQDGMAAYRRLSEAELDRLVEETEKKMLGIPNIEDFKVSADGEMETSVTLDQATLRSFIITRGRAPTLDEIREMLKGRR
jgi:hypothetical protein